MKKITYLLLLGVLVTGLAMGFNFGYYSGFMDAKGQSKKEQVKFYSDFVKKVSIGNVFHLWDFKVVPVKGAQVKICSDSNLWTAAKTVGGYKFQNIKGISLARSGPGFN